MWNSLRDGVQVPTLLVFMGSLAVLVATVIELTNEVRKQDKSLTRWSRAWFADKAAAARAGFLGVGAFLLAWGSGLSFFTE